MNFITTNTDAPIYSKKDMLKFKASVMTLNEYTEKRSPKKPKAANLKEIYDTCCYAFGTKPINAQKTRYPEHVMSRQSTHYFATLLTNRPFRVIAKAIGRLDHSSVNHSKKCIRTILELGDKDPRGETIRLIADRLSAKYNIDVRELMKIDRDDEDLRKMWE